MKTRILILVVFLSVLLAGCSKVNYFPVNEGEVISFDVQVYSPPLISVQVRYPLDDGKDSVVYTGRNYLSDETILGNVDGRLILKVAGNAETNNCLESDGINIEIVEDTLGIFTDVKLMLWELERSDEINEILIYPPDTVFAPIDSLGEQTKYDGCTRRPMYFSNIGEKKTISLINRKPLDGLVNAGVDTNVPGYEGIKLMHFQRQVEPYGGSDYIDSAFTEDTWYAPDIGLVRLEQRINGIQAMLWTRK